MQTCPQGTFLTVFKGLGLDFLSSSQTVPFNNLSKSFCSHQVPNNSHQIPLVFINNPSKSFCSHQVPKKSLLFPSVTCQKPFVFIKFPSNSFCFRHGPTKIFLFPSSSHQLHFVPNPTLHKHTQSSKLCERLGHSAKRSAAVPGQAGRGAPVAGGRLPYAAEQKGEIFCLPGLVEDRG